MLKKLTMGLLLSSLAVTANAELDSQTQVALKAAIDGAHRSDKNKARDVYRKPMQVLDFLGFRSDMKVVEIWPGGGWYTDILAPALKDKGQLVAAQFDLNGPYGYQRRGLGAFFTKLGSNPKLFRQVEVTQFALPYQLQLTEAGSADMVLTFRNVHNWVMPLYGEGDYAHLAFKASFDALKPGGILGVVDHKWDDASTEDPKSENGYISVARTVELAKSAGFELVAESHILANPKDTKDYDRGVWSLPPVLAFGEQDQQKYLEIGESDRFLLKFVKPVK